mgnify:FL=1
MIFKFFIIFLLIPILSYSSSDFSGNPIIINQRTADASPQVWSDGKLWIYTSGDYEFATNYSKMDHYKCYSTTNMVDWEYHGIILSAKDLIWGNPNEGFMFAPDAAYKNGKYYLYFPHRPVNGKGWKVGVAISDKPEGPFIDIGKPIDGPDHIDPMCFIDDNDEAYLYWGFGRPGTPYVAKLKKKMIELAEQPKVVDYGSNDFFEAAFLHKYKNKYYFSYNQFGTSKACYGIGGSPYGPFKNMGVFADAPSGAQSHPGIISYKDQWYYFYHRGDYTLNNINGSLYRRNICIEYLYYDENDFIKKIKYSKRGVKKLSIK